MTPKYETRPIKWLHAPVGEDLFGERGITIEIKDESGGEFVAVTSQDGASDGVKIDPDEWPTLWAAIDHAIKQCREEKKEKA
jgi:hypothetical protein